MKIVETTAGSVTSIKQFVWSSGVMPRESRDNTGTVLSQYFVRGQMDNTTKHLYVKDYPGSIREMTDNSGVIQAQYSFDPFGRLTKLAGSLDSDFQFASYYSHIRSGLNLTLARAYSPGLGRWISRDPVGENWSSNRYAYVDNVPVNEVDYLGLFASSGSVGGGGGGGDDPPWWWPNWIPWPKLPWPQDPKKKKQQEIEDDRDKPVETLQECLKRAKDNLKDSKKTAMQCKSKSAFKRAKERYREELEDCYKRAGKNPEDYLKQIEQELIDQFKPEDEP